MRTPSQLLSPVVAGMLYFGAATLALLTSRFDNGLAFLWIGNAFLIAELITSPRRHWWRTIVACSAASAVATALFGMGPAAALPMVVANMVESVLLAALYRQIVPRTLPAGSLRPLAIFTLLLCLLATPLSGLIGAATAAILTAQPFWMCWLQWYAGHVLGGLVGTPLLAMALRGDLKTWWGGNSRGLKLEAALLLSLFAGLVFLVFYVSHYPLLFVPLVALVLIAFRQGHVGAAAAVLVLAAVGGAATLTGHGPINQFDVPMGMRIQFLQLYLAACFMIAMPVSAELNGRRALFQLLRESEARYRLMADSSGDMMLTLSADGMIQYASAPVERLLGIKPATLIGQSLTVLAQAADRQTVRGGCEDALHDPDLTHRLEFRPAGAAEAVQWCEMVVRAIVDDRGIPAGLVCSVRDMSVHKANQRQLLKAAFIDQLTGAASRRAFLAQLESEIGEAGRDRKSCVALVDIDHFKQVNDHYGHGAGDEVLRAFTDRLRAGTRGVDLIGRLGGEEFAILLPGSDLIGASHICERLRAAVAAMRVTLEDGRSVSITFSAGLVEIEPGTTAQALLEAADKALYAAKHGGRNCLRLAA